MLAERWIRAAAPAIACALLTTAAFAQERRPRVDVQNIQLQAEVNPRTQSVTATVAVRLVPLEDRQQTAVFELNNALRLSRVVDGAGRQVQASRSQDDHSIRINFPDPLDRGKAETLVFTYDGRLTGSEESPVYGINFAAIKADFAFLMYPARWFPVSDYTVDRYSMNMKITVPAGFKVLGSGIGTKSDSSGGDVYEFDYTRESFPGSIAVVQGDAYLSRSGGISTELYFRGDEKAMAAGYGDETAKIVTMLTALYGIPPAANLTVVETDAGAPNGYSAPGILFLSPKGIGKEVGSRLLVNQIARQWWGIQVSPSSRNHIWITNAAARFSELYWIEQTAGQAAAEAELKDIHVESLTVSEPPVMQSGRLEDYSPEYWAVTAAKGTSVLAMLRYTIGDEAFGKLMKFPVTNGWKSVSTDDFRKAAEAAAGRSLQGFFIQWIESTGAPEFKLQYTVFRLGEQARAAGNTNGFRIMGKISQDLDTFRMPVDVQIETDGNPESKTVDVVGTSSEFVIESFGRPKKIIVDPNGRLLRMDDAVRVAVAIRRGEMFAEVSEFGDALKEYQKALDVNRNSSLAYYRSAEVHFLQGNYQPVANMFREVLKGDLDPNWTEVWARINLGKIFDISEQRDRAINEYNQAIRTKDNTQGAQEEAAKYLKEPYQRPARSN